MSYLDSLTWFKDFQRFDEKTKKLLMALSERRFKYRNLSTLYRICEMDTFTLDSIIKNLETRGLIYIRTHSTSGSIIIGLRERQDTLPTGMLIYMINGIVQDSFVVEYTKMDTEPLFRNYIKENILHDITDIQIDDIMRAGFYKWEVNQIPHVINITNTKIIPV